MPLYDAEQQFKTVELIKVNAHLEQGLVLDFIARGRALAAG